MGQDMKHTTIVRIVNDLEKQGCRIRLTKMGWFLYLPNGETMVFHLTPSDRRAQNNQKAKIKRAGLHWPLDKKSK
jgi:hypothetical protein